MRAMDVKEFTGTRYVALNLEHNFRSLPFLAMGIPFLYKNSFELIINGGIANAWGWQRQPPGRMVLRGRHRPEPHLRALSGGWHLATLLPRRVHATVGLAQIF